VRWYWCWGHGKLGRRVCACVCGGGGGGGGGDQIALESGVQLNELADVILTSTITTDDADP
jgi:hypothetical protein